MRNDQALAGFPFRRDADGNEIQRISGEKMHPNGDMIVEIDLGSFMGVNRAQLNYLATSHGDDFFNAKPDTKSDIVSYQLR